MEGLEAGRSVQEVVLQAQKEAVKAAAVSVQPQEEPYEGGFFPLSFLSSDEIAPSWNAADRDTFIRSFWKSFGNDLVSSAVAACVAKIETQNWILTGPKRVTKFYHQALREDADFGRGWSSLIARGVQDYYTQDNGWFIERLRSSPEDFEGPALGFAHLDSARMHPTGNPDRPYTYWDIEGNQHLMHKSQLIRIVDLPSPTTEVHGLERGFCALSRCLSTAMVLTMLASYKREKLSDLPPSAIAVLNNISRKQFEAALSLHSGEQRDKGNAVWKSIMPLFGIDPSHPASLNFISLREVWEGFDEQTAMNIAVYSVAAGFRIDPREIWPVSGGSLGTGREAEIQHEKAKSKSHGLLFTSIERQLNHRFSLPPEVTFKFELQDSEEEQLKAGIEASQIGNIKTMQDAGAGLTPAEVRFLLVKKYSILPEFMLDVPKEGEAATPAGEEGMDEAYLDDTERVSASKEMHLGDIISFDYAGKAVTLSKRHNEDISLLPEPMQASIRKLGSMLDAGFETRMQRFAK